jgi:hypothetical protein
MVRYSRNVVCVGAGSGAVSIGILVLPLLLRQLLSLLTYCC